MYHDTQTRTKTEKRMVRLVHLPTKLSQVNLHSTHPVVLPHFVVVKQGDVNEVVKLLIPASNRLQPFVWV